MNYWLRIFRQSPLFASCDDLQIESCLKALDHSIKSYKKNETIFMEGAKIEQIGLVLKGTVRIESVDYEGAVHLYTVVEPSFCFGETYAFLGKTLKVSAIANTDCFVFLFSIKNLPPCILENLLRIALLKNEILSERIEHASKKTIRKKVLSYLSAPKKEGWFTIPFNREQMASYLNVERSALSKELGKMKKEGLIDFHRNRFCLLKKKIQN